MRMSVKIKSDPNFFFRGLAQLGSAPGLGPGGRWFESSNPDAKLGIRRRMSILFCVIHKECGRKLLLFDHL